MTQTMKRSILLSLASLTNVCRLSPVNRARWNSCIGMLHISQDVSKVSGVTFQLILKRLMYTVVKQMVVPSNLTLKSAASSLTDKEENVVRYVAGYVIMKLKKKYRKHHHQYASVLDSMKTSLDEYESSILHQYMTTVAHGPNKEIGVVYIDHVNNNFFALTKAIELVCRQHLDVRTDPSDVMLSKIEEDALKTEAVTSLWETMTVSLDTASQKMDLLKSVIKLWSTIRIHSYIHLPYHGQTNSV